MVEVDIEAALKYPVRGEDAVTIHAIGGGIPVVLNLAMLFVAFVGIVFPPLYLLYLPLFPVQLAIGVGWLGYFLRVTRTTFAGATEPPGFDDWEGLARDGLWGFLIALAYQAPLFVLAGGGYALVFVLFLGAGSAATADSGVGVAAAGILGIVLMLVVFAVVFVYSVAAAYLLPISLVAYADEGSLGAAFSIETFRSVGLSAEYAVPWVVAAGAYGAVVGVVSFLASLLIGYLLVPFLPLFYFFLGTAGFRMFAQAYAVEEDLAIPGIVDGEGPSPASAGGAERRPEDL